MRRAGWAGHDRALTVAGPVTSITRGPWVTDTPPRRVLASEGVSLWGFHLRRAWGSSQEESPEGNPLTGESAAHRDSRAGATSAGWGSLAPAGRRLANRWAPGPSMTSMTGAADPRSAE